MRKEFVSFVGAVALFGSATVALAGAYGEAQQGEETPSSPPPAAMKMEQEVDYARTGCYLGAGGSYAFALFDENKGVDVGNSGGFFVRTGYRVHPNIAVEALYENMVEFDADPSGHFDGWALSADVKGFMLTGRFQPYALIGVGYLDMDAHNHAAQRGGDGAEMRFGLGMDACITEHISAGPEVAYVLPFGDASHFDTITLSLGLNYKF